MSQVRLLSPLRRTARIVGPRTRRTSPTARQQLATPEERGRMSDSAETATGLGSADDGDPTPARGRSVKVAEQPRRGNPVSRLLTFYRQVVAELRKVIWPTRRELVTYTAVVLVFVVFMVALVSIYDFAAAQGVLKVFGTG
jgi:preprotein translocase subunit SecE